MNKNEINNLGKDIRKIINKSIENGNYQDIGNNVSKTVGSALDSAFAEARKAINTVQKDTSSINIHINEKESWDQFKGLFVKKPASPLYFKNVPVGGATGILLMVFGSISIGLFSLGTILSASLGGPGILTAIFIGLIFGGVLMNVRGASLRKRLKRFRRYLSLFKGRNACDLDELEAYTGYDHKFVIKDLTKMIQVGMFPQAQFDHKETMIMLNTERYNQYLEELDELEKQQQSLKDAADRTDTDIYELNSAIMEAKQFIASIKDARLKIQDNDVSVKIHRLETIISKIVDYIEEHPSQLSEVRRMLQFYLPTTMKLLNAYQEFERHSIQGENIKNTKDEIKDALDTINEAFENLFDRLFESVSMDVSTDISVLETMLAQEGLTEEEFQFKKSKG